MIAAVLGGLRAELGDLRLRGPRAQQGYAVSLAVALSVAAASMLTLQNVWWAAISAFTVSQATRPASVRRGALRIAGTTVGAFLALGCASTLAYDHVLCALFLLAAGTAGTLGFLVSPYGYAWLLAAVTALMVALMSLTDPTVALAGALNRIGEVAVGTGAAILAALLFAPDGEAARPPAPGFTDLLGANRPALMHALRSGIVVMLIPLVWIGFDLPSLPQMGVTAAAVMAVQPQAGFDDHATFVTRGTHRMLGCLVGGAAALVLLALPLTEFLPWLLALTAGVFVCTQIQSGLHGIGYVGTQAAVVYIMTLVQGTGPPTSILPGIERLAGITGGLAVLLLVSLVLWPTRGQAALRAPP
ncbi:MAG: FUSC family protein [Acetobacteraceae bacterium]